jgi:hypothetical protein
MDPSILMVLRALASGPASPGILWTRYGMEKEEGEAALTQAVDEGLVEEVPPIAFGLTRDGVRVLRERTGEHGRTATSLRHAGRAAEEQKYPHWENLVPSRFGQS